MTETYLPPRQPPGPPVPPWTYPGQNYLPPLPPEPPKRNRLRRNTVALIAAATLAAGGIGGTVGALVGGDQATPTAAAPTATATSDTKPVDVSNVVAKVEKSVVQVNVRLANGEGIGSGVIVSADGRIVTNNHVVANADQVTVTLSDGRELPATVEGTDPATDLAVIQAQGASDLTPATFGDSGTVHVGDQVIAIGSPGGLQGTVTTGIVSALDREVNVPAGEQQQSPYMQRSQNGSDTVSYRAIQTDASINHGNSGGPLFNTAGEVIGINSAIYSPVSGPDGSAGSVGIGFAIPSDNAKQVLDKL